MDNIETKKGNLSYDLKPKAYQKSMQRRLSDVSHQIDFSENDNNSKDHPCHENTDVYFNDEESMIPKGLLDQPFDKPDHFFNDIATPTHSTNMMSYGIPCYIAVFPQPSERQINYNQLNNAPSYFPAEPSCVYSPGNDYMFPNQRDARTFNNPQCSRNYQGVDYNWWGHSRQNQTPFISSTNVEMRTPSAQRNIGMVLAERYYDPQSIHEHPYEYHQRELNYRAHFGYGYENNYPNSTCTQPTFSKPLCRNQNKYRREFQLSPDGNTYYKNTYLHELSTATNVNRGINFTNTAIPKYEETSRTSADNEQLISYLNFWDLKYKSKDFNTFKKTALEGCLQLEKLLANNNTLLAKNLQELCRSMKSQLSHSMNAIQTELVIRELILGFLHICNSWVCISSIITMKQDQSFRYESSLQALLMDFENWQKTSKTLLEKLLVAVQEISFGPEKCNKDIYKCTGYTKESPDSEKIQNDLDQYKKDLLKNELKQRQQNISSVTSLKNELLNIKPILLQWSESENNDLLKYYENNDNHCIFNDSTSNPFHNNQQCINSTLNKNTKQQVVNHFQSNFCSTSSENISDENSFCADKCKSDEKEMMLPVKKVINFLLQKTNSLSNQDKTSYLSTKHSFSCSIDNELSNGQENAQNIITTVQPEILGTENTILENDDCRMRMQPDEKYNEIEEKELKNKSNIEVNRNYQVNQERFNPKYNRKRNLKNKMCSFSKNYNSPGENVTYTEQFNTETNNSKSKPENIFSVIQEADLEKLITQRISENDMN